MIWVISGASADVAKGLEDLTIEMKDLDPSAIDFMKTYPLGKIFNPVRRYFTKFEDSDKAIGDIIKSLDKGETPLEMTTQHWSWNRHPCVTSLSS